MEATAAKFTQCCGHCGCPSFQVKVLINFVVPSLADRSQYRKGDSQFWALKNQRFYIYVEWSGKWKNSPISKYYCGRFNRDFGCFPLCCYCWYPFFVNRAGWRPSVASAGPSVFSFRFGSRSLPEWPLEHWMDCRTKRSLYTNNMHLF